MYLALKFMRNSWDRKLEILKRVEETEETKEPQVMSVLANNNVSTGNPRLKKIVFTNYTTGSPRLKMP